MKVILIFVLLFMAMAVSVSAVDYCYQENVTDTSCGQTSTGNIGGSVASDVNWYDDDWSTFANISVYGGDGYMDVKLPSTNNFSHVWIQMKYYSLNQEDTIFENKTIPDKCIYIGDTNNVIQLTWNVNDIYCFNESDSLNYALTSYATPELLYDVGIYWYYLTDTAHTGAEFNTYWDNTYTGVPSSSGRGVKVVTGNYSVNFTTGTKISSVDAVSWCFTDENHSVLVNGTFSGDNAYINYLASPNTVYYFKVACAGESYTTHYQTVGEELFPSKANYFNITGGWDSIDTSSVNYDISTLTGILAPTCKPVDENIITVFSPLNMTYNTDYVEVSFLTNFTDTCIADYDFQYGLFLDGWDTPLSPIALNNTFGELYYSNNFTGIPNGAQNFYVDILYPAGVDTSEALKVVPFYINYTAPCTNFSDGMISIVEPSYTDELYTNNWSVLTILVNTTGQDCYIDYNIYYNVLGLDNYYYIGIEELGLSNMNETYYSFNFTDMLEGQGRLDVDLCFPSNDANCLNTVSRTYIINTTQPIPEPVPPVDEGSIVSATNNSLVSMLVLYIIIGTVLALILFYADSFPVSDDVKTWIVYVTVAVLVIFGIIVLTTVFRAFASLT